MSAHPGLSLALPGPRRGNGVKMLNDEVNTLPKRILLGREFQIVKVSSHLVEGEALELGNGIGVVALRIERLQPKRKLRALSRNARTGATG